MRLGILSDFHLAPPPLNRCTSDPDALTSLLVTLHQECDQVILAGDVYDLLRPRKWRAWRALQQSVHEQWPALAEQLNRCRAIYGNHDIPLSTQNTPEALRFETSFGDLLVIHGHQSDPLLKKVWGLQEGANFVAGHFERLGLDAVSTWMGQVPEQLDRLTPNLTSSLSTDTQEPSRILRFAQGQLADVVICGHTHALDLISFEGQRRLFVNSGSHAHGHMDWVVCDLEEGEVEIWRDGSMLKKATRERAQWHVEELV